MKAACYICNETDHLALWCPRYPKYRGNLMRMYLKLNSQQKDASKQKFELERPEEDQDNYVGDEELRPDYFVYADENQEDKHFPSWESVEALPVKEEHLIKFVRQKEDLKAGLAAVQARLAIAEDPTKKAPPVDKNWQRSARGDVLDIGAAAFIAKSALIDTVTEWLRPLRLGLGSC